MFCMGRNWDSSVDSLTSGSDLDAGIGLGGSLAVGFLEGESKRYVSSIPLLEAGMGERGAEKLDSMSWRCCLTAISAWESECLSSMLGPSMKLLSGTERSGAGGWRGGIFSGFIAVALETVEEGRRGRLPSRLSLMGDAGLSEKSAAASFVPVTLCAVEGRESGVFWLLSLRLSLRLSSSSISAVCRGVQAGSGTQELVHTSRPHGRPGAAAEIRIATAIAI